MKHFALTLACIFIFLMTVPHSATAADINRGYDGTKFIFVEGGVEFSVFPDGQFDFIYLGPGNQGTQISINTPNVAVNYNSGYNYDAYVQYDSYGAVIQIEDVPVYYDEYGRIIQAGSVSIRYNNRRLVSVGGLFVHYNPYGYYSHYTGYINVYNRYYVYRPWHTYYVTPYSAYCVVYTYPYRRYYSPVRYSYSYHSTYYRNGYAYANGRRNFYRPGSRVHYQDGRVAANRNYKVAQNSNGRIASTTYRRDDQVIRTDFNSRAANRDQTGKTADTRLSTINTTQRNTQLRSAVSNDGQKQKNSSVNNIRNTERVQRNTTDRSKVSKVDHAQRNRPNTNVRKSNVQRNNVATPHVKSNTAGANVRNNSKMQKGSHAMSSQSQTSKSTPANNVSRGADRKSNTVTQKSASRLNARGGRG